MCRWDLTYITTGHLHYRGVFRQAIQGCDIQRYLYGTLFISFRNRSYHCNITFFCYNANAAKGSKISKMSSLFVNDRKPQLGGSDQIMTLTLFYFTPLLQTVVTVEVVGFCSSCVSLSHSTIKEALGPIMSLFVTCMLNM